ncbi:MAG: PKD domain-containing protein, partial [Lysobacterales bacterium]
YEVQLLVNDGTEESAPDTVVIDTQNSKPVAMAEPDQTVPIGSTVQLDGSHSNDVDGDPLTFLWSIIARPTGSTATLSDPLVVNPTFVADLAGIYVAQLIVNDGIEDSDPATVTIITANTPPVAEAGPDQTVPLGSTVQLDGSASSDGEGDPLTFLWTLTSQPSGSTATLSDATVVNPTFVPDIIGDYTVELVVNDGTDDSSPDSVIITAENTPPVADAGPDQAVSPNATVGLDGSGSSDLNNDALGFQWSFLSQPIGSTASLSNPAVVNPTFVADLEGAYVLQLIVNDGTVNSGPDTVTITAVNDPPVLDPVGNQIVQLGQSLTFTLSGSDPNGDPISFTATPLPLPANMTLNGTSGMLTFTPDATQVGDHILTMMMSDGVLTDTETITITVQGAPPGGVTELIGRILDTNDFTSTGTETPVVGATVTILGSGITTTSDLEGNFTLTGLPAGTQVFDIDSSTAAPGPGDSSYAGFREKIELIADVTNMVERPFFLPRIDPASQMLVNGTPVSGIDPNNMTIVDNPSIGVSIMVPPHTAKNPDGTDFIGALTISEVPDGLAPAALPDELQPGLLITIQPVGVIFDPPVAITFPNIDNLAPGNEVDIWSLEPASGQFVIVGTGEVSADGTELNTISGGVRAADWHMSIPPKPDRSGKGDPPTDPPPKCKETKDENSQITICGGELIEEHQLTPYRSVEVDRGAILVYHSGSADPQPILFNNPTISSISAVPDQMSVRLQVAGVEQGTEVFTDTSSFSETQNESLRQVLQFDGSAFSTGHYPYQLTLTSHFAQSSVGNTLSGNVLIRNEQQSPFGAGWTLKGLSRLQVQTNDSAVLTTGEGGVMVFERPKPGTFATPVPLATNTGPNGTAALVGDFNNDTMLDVVVPRTSGVNARAVVFLGNGDGT